MSLLSLSIIGLVMTSTALLSGIFGMAGGMVLMGVLLMMLPVPATMVLHAVAQMTSNGWRALVWRRHIAGRIFARYLIGLTAAAVLMVWISYVPDRATVLLCLGGIPFVVMAIPPRWVLQAHHRMGAELCGFVNMLMQFVAGVSGPLLDAFFLRTPMDRRAVVATKAVCQAASHVTKLVYFLHIGMSEGLHALPWYVYVVTVAASVFGTSLSKLVLERLSDAQFYRWTRGIVLVIGAVYLAQGLYMVTTSS